MKSKFRKALILSASGLTLLGIGLAGGSNPGVQDSVQNAKNHIEMPISHADNSNKFNLSKRVTSKQFTVDYNNNDTDDISSGTFASINKRTSKKVDKYLRSVNNLSDYHVHISRIDTVEASTNDIDNSETATITFIRK